jgi:hypothetical protein
MTDLFCGACFGPLQHHHLPDIGEAVACPHCWRGLLEPITLAEKTKRQNFIRDAWSAAVADGLIRHP